jgi:N-acetylglutamate synthase-like GNAT family acetyltransferase
MLRKFRPEDAPSCCQLIHDCLAGDPSISTAFREKLIAGETPQSMEERARLFYIAVCEREGRIAGLVGLELNEIRLLYVSPRYQRMGIGGLLIEHIKAMVPRSLFSDIFVYASLQSIEFYRACGFIDKGSFNFDVGGESLPTIFMTFSLTSAE